MALRQKRSRLTKLLVDIAHDRFHACEVCCRSEAFDTVDDALGPLRLKARERTRLLQQLTCPLCGSQVCSGTAVATYTAEQLRQFRLSKKFDLLYGAQLRGFRNFLIKHPMLGSEHHFGPVLSKAMKKAEKAKLEPSIWYRAARYSDGPKFKPRASHESTRANRFNQIGQAAWYLGSDEKTAAVEIMRQPKAGQPVRLAKIKLLEPVVVLDLRSVIWGTDPIRQWVLRNVVDSRFISEPTVDIEDTRPQCRVPQFIADLARSGRFRGILYDSTRPSAYNNPEAAGHNLVLFDPFPAYDVESEMAVEFVETDYDPMFSPERWPLRTLPSAK